ncbi:bifunctional diguanylate cyclase/phosphodiesterase [Algicola sagamiensis]|uniref:bifunctional diguanylate cyclase/phosphodiesterase n=1 Tax=Algicola sagamiensis TaxID=163869 RepID=UPI00036B090D|nr:EAL domain-containing protein [Algicola sagamiensis]
MFANRTINSKVSFTVFLICSLFGTLLSIIVFHHEKSDFLHEQKALLSQLSTHFSLAFEKQLVDMEDIALAANRKVKQRLFRKGEPANISVELDEWHDGSTRQSEEESAAYIGTHALTDFHKRQFNVTAEIWRDLAPIMRQKFYAFYYISTENFIRISPPKWSLDVLAGHDFQADLFFKVARPDFNPEQRAVWTPIYYDVILRRWMTSFIIPIYDESNQFQGLTGSDYELYALIQDLKTMNQANKVHKIMLLDQQGRILYFPGLSEQHPGELPKVSPTLKAFGEKIQQNGWNEEDVSLIYEGRKYLVSASPVHQLNWTLVVLADEETVFQSMSASKWKLPLIFFLVTLVVALLLHLSIDVLLLRRIRRLYASMSDLMEKHWIAEPTRKNQDEVAELSSAFDTMVGEINILMQGLNERLIEKDSAEAAAQKLSNAIACSGMGIVITDHHMNIEHVNPKWLELAKGNEESFIHQSLYTILSPEMQTLRHQIISALDIDGYWQGEVRMALHVDQDIETWLSLSISEVRDHQKHLTNYIACALDITLHKKNESQVERLAFYDPLTQIPNRQYLMGKLQKLSSLVQQGYYSFAILALDIDDFSRLNDTLGHQLGDLLLSEIVSRCQSLLKDSDIIARVGGDEFAIIIGDVKDVDAANLIIENVMKIIEEPIYLGGHDLRVSVSIGASLVQRETESGMVFQQAELALLCAKQKGVGQVVFFHPLLNQEARESLALEQQLRQAIQNQEFKLHFQPQLELSTQKIRGVEALLRWEQPESGMISPAKFIPIAEQSGLIREIGHWVIQEAVAAIARFQQEGFYDLKVAVNVSAQQLIDKDFITFLERSITMARIRPALLELEITESMLVQDIDTAIELLNQLKLIGVSLAIDDFGTGYSSLSYLSRFPVNKLKIDRSFILEIENEENDRAIVCAIIAMAQKLSIRTIAEGIESEFQQQFLEHNQCDCIQGYFLSHPLPEEQLLSFITQHQKTITRQSA